MNATTRGSLLLWTFLLFLNAPDSVILAAESNSAVEMPPKEATEAVKSLIADLQKPGLKQKVDAALSLSKKAMEAVPAIPFLIDNLGDTRDGAPAGYHWSQPVWTPQSSAQDALTKIIPFANGWGFSYATKKLADESSELREALVKVLPAYGERAIAPLLKIFKTDDSDHVLAAAARALGTLKGPAIEPLREILKNSSDKSIRQKAAYALVAAGGRDTLPDLIVAFDDARNDSWTKEAICKSICSVADVRAIGVLTSIIRNEKYPDYAVEALVGIKDKKAVDAFFSCVEDPKIECEDALLRALPKVDDPRVVPAVLRAAASTNDSTRNFAIIAMGERPDIAFVPILFSAVNDPHEWVRAHAVQSLVNQKTDKRALFLKIIEVIDEKNENVRRAQIDALKSLSGRNFGDDKGKWKDWFDAFGADFNWDRKGS
jgi:HEAT repeat protein